MKTTKHIILGIICLAFIACSDSDKDTDWDNNVPGITYRSDYFRIGELIQLKGYFSTSENIVHAVDKNSNRYKLTIKRQERRILQIEVPNTVPAGKYILELEAVGKLFEDTEPIHILGANDIAVALVESYTIKRGADIVLHGSFPPTKACKIFISSVENAEIVYEIPNNYQSNTKLVARYPSDVFKPGVYYLDVENSVGKRTRLDNKFSLVMN